MIIGRPTLLAGMILTLCACATPAPHPEPKIVTRTVNIEVPVPCDPKVGPEPKLPDTPDAVQAVPQGDLLDLVKLLLAGREIRDAYIQEQAQGLKGCAQLPGGVR